MARLPAALAGRVGVALVAALVGFLVVSQLRGQQRFTQRLETESEGDLARILASLNTESDQLREEIATLKLQLVTLETSSQRDESALAAAREQLEALEVLAGTVPVHGPGVVLRITDPGRVLGFETMVDMVQELRDAGAEAIAVNGVRVGVRSAFGEKGGAILLDDEPLQPPYSVVAIGQADTLEAGLSIPGGVLDTLGAENGVTASVERRADVQVPALAEPPSFRVARPVASSP